MRHVYAIFAVTFLLATANSSASEQTINGKIKAVDAGKNSITVDDVVLDVSRKTKITVDGKKATLADINPGQQAIVTYDDSLEAAITIAIGAVPVALTMSVMHLGGSAGSTAVPPRPDVHLVTTDPDSSPDADAGVPAMHLDTTAWAAHRRLTDGGMPDMAHLQEMLRRLEQ